MIKKLIFFLLIFTLESKANEVSFGDSIIKYPAPGANVTMGYTTISSNKSLSIIKIESKDVNNISVHTQVKEKWVVMDKEVYKPRIYSNRPFVLKPGDDYLFLTGINKKISVGDKVKMTFTFQSENNEIFQESYEFTVE